MIHRGHPWMPAVVDRGDDSPIEAGKIPRLSASVSVPAPLALSLVSLLALLRIHPGVGENVQEAFGSQL